MSDVLIRESGMVFGPYAAADVWHLEDCPLYKQRQDGIKMAEFAVVRRSKDTGSVPQVWLIEAKSSVPRTDPVQPFSEYMKEIREKMQNGVKFLVGAWLGWYSPEVTRAPEAFQSCALGRQIATQPMCCVLVIRPVPTEYLPPLQEAFCRELHPYLKLLNVRSRDIHVINGETAHRLGLVSE